MNSIVTEIFRIQSNVAVGGHCNTGCETGRFDNLMDNFSSGTYCADHLHFVPKKLHVVETGWLTLSAVCWRSPKVNMFRENINRNSTAALENSQSAQ